MSGICGWISDAKQLGDAEATLARMAAALPKHGVGTRNGEADSGAALAIRAVAGCGDWAADRNWVAAIEGSPSWSDPALAETARARGHGHALIEAYSTYGADFLDSLHGAFALAVIDRVARRGLLAIDRWGIQTLCIAQPSAGIAVFGSTTDSVRAFPGMKATILPQTLYTYLYLIDRIPAPSTVYEEQRKLAPGEYVTIDRGKFEVRSYWRMPYRDGGRNDIDELAAELFDQLRSSVGRSIAGESPARVGAFLSGGLDSSTIAGLLAEALAPEPARTFTIGFDLDAYDETPFAQIVADHFGTDHSVYFTSPDDLFRVVRDIATFYDEPFANSSAIPAYFCALRAREAGVDLMLAGDGGDELFGGNSRYLSDAVFDHYQAVPATVRRFIVEPFLGMLPLRNRAPLLRRAANYVRYASMSVPERMHRSNVFVEVDAAGIFKPEAMAAIDPGVTLSRLDEIYDSAGSNSKLHRMFQFDLRITLADSDLRKVGRMCELAGVRVRYPFLDDTLGAFSAGIAPEMLMRDGELRGFYKYAMRGFLPKAVLTKSKHGFGIPGLEYVRVHPRLTELFCEVIGDLKNRPWFSAKFIDDVVARVRAGDTRCYSSVAWDLAMLELWLRSREPFSS